MSTTKPRVSVTLEPRAYEAVRALAALNGQSVSSVISELLAAVLPTVERVVEAGERFRALSDELQNQISGEFEDAETRIAPALDALAGEVFGLLGFIPAPDQDPRLVTRGSRPPIRSQDLDKGGLGL